VPPPRVCGTARTAAGVRRPGTVAAIRGERRCRRDRNPAAGHRADTSGFARPGGSARGEHRPGGRRVRTGAATRAVHHRPLPRGRRGDGRGCLVACNKSDLAGTEALRVLEEFHAVGYPVLRVSAMSGTGLEALQAHLAGRCSILVGTVRCRQVVAVECSAARHRIWRRHRYPPPPARGGTAPRPPRCIHCPAAVPCWILPACATSHRRWAIPRLTAAGFREIVAAAERCRFANCRHMREPDCAVKDGHRGRQDQRAPLRELPSAPAPDRGLVALGPVPT
jgi:hypothetical protein